MKEGTWELDIKSNNLKWSDSQFGIYGYEPGEIKLNTEFFILKTTHFSEIKRITAIVDHAVKNDTEYNFKRRIIKKDGKIGFVETNARIFRTAQGKAERIEGTTRDLSDATLFGAACYTHPTFFDRLYNNYKKAIFFEIFRIIREEDISDDLCQEVFVKAWNNLYQYDHKKGELYTWLVNIARNHCKDYFKSKNFRVSQRSSSLDNLKTLPFSDQTNMSSYDIDKLMMGLSTDHREVIDLLFLKGYTQQEVSIIKNYPLGTVKTKSRNALSILRDQIL